MSVDLQMKILLVEDSRLTRQMEVKILKEVGFNNIVEAEDGDAAIEILQKDEEVRLIISDWNMPNKGGYDLLVWVRANQQWKDVPFIMATAQAEKKQTVKAKEAGVSSLITKPFSTQELKTVIEETFGAVERSGGAEMQKVREPQIGASGKVQLNIAHIQITDHLILGVLQHLISTKQLTPVHFELQTQCMPSWNPLQKALENGKVDGAFILAPIAMDLFSVDVPIKLVLFAHKNGSICVSNKQGSNGESLQAFFKGKSFYLPHILSIHHMLSSMFLQQLGLKPGVVGDKGVDAFFEVVPPVKMPEFMAQNPEVAGYTVAEPLGTKAIASGTGDLMFLSAEIWENHPCCVVTMRNEIVDRHPEAVQEFTTMLVRAGQYIARHPEKAAEIAVDFLDPKKLLGLTVPVLQHVIEDPLGIKTDDLFPVREDLDRMQRYMVEQMGIGTPVDLDAFVVTRFAEVACEATQSVRRSSRFHELPEVISRIVKRQNLEDPGETVPNQPDYGQALSRLGESKKVMLKKEGKHLIFNLDSQEYGIGIISVKEIIGMMPIRSVPQTPEFVKGVINLRGKVIPVIDLRLKFGLDALDYNERTCIIIVEVQGKSDVVQIGVVVDAVSEVLNVAGEDIEDPPSFGANVDMEVILGLAKAENGVRILLDTDRLLSCGETEMLGAVT